MVLGAGLLALFATSAWALYLVTTRWQDVPGPLRPVRVGVGGLLLILATVGGYLALRETLHREYLHDEGGRRGKADALFGILLRGEGQAVRVDPPFVPGTRSLDGALVFASMRVIHPMLAKVLRSSSQPKAVDTAVLAAFLGLAARGHVELVAGWPRWWLKGSDVSLTARATGALTVTVRRRAAGEGLREEEGWLEQALLAAIGGHRPGPPRSSGSPVTGPYRRGRDEVRDVEAADGEPVRVEAILATLTEGRRQPRLHLHRLLRAEAAGAASRTEDAEVAGEELLSVLPRRKWGPGRALLAHVEEALADRGQPPPTPDRG
jgi:hypothetical protein